MFLPINAGRAGCRQERDGDVFSRHRSQLRQKTVNHLQDRLQARRKGGALTSVTVMIIYEEGMHLHVS